MAVRYHHQLGPKDGVHTALKAWVVNGAMAGEILTK